MMQVDITRMGFDRASRLHDHICDLLKTLGLVGEDLDRATAAVFAIAAQRVEDEMEIDTRRRAHLRLVEKD
jgi:hypothetical protein